MFYVTCVYDAMSDSYSTPFFVRAKGLAVRSFIDAVNSSSKDTDVSRHPKDFRLVCIGTFDESTGAIVPLDSPEVLMSGLSAASSDS